MQKNQLPQREWRSPVLLTKALMLMKLTAVLLLCTCLQVSANVFSQEAKVTMKMKQASIQSLFKTIEKKTDYRFVFSNDVIPTNLTVSIEVKETPVSEVLSHVLDNTGLDFRMMVNGLIVVANRNDIHRYVPISGKVVDINGGPLEGVSVTIKGSSGGSLTNAAGIFTLNADPSAELIFSYVGFETQTIQLNGRRNITVTMEGIRELAGVTVVNTGYQVLNKERATGAFGYVSKEQLERPTTNIAQRLIGAVSGVQARLNVDGDPTFEIRGQTGLERTAIAPLVVVDGFPIQGDFSTINPNNVESVTVLKDAAAASIWGAKSGNGVIVVTTKNARKGIPLKVEVSAFTKIGSKFDLDYVNPLASSAETVDYEMASFNKWSAQNNTGSFQSNVGWSWSQGSTALNEHALGFITLQQRDSILNKLKTMSNKQQIKDHLLENPVTQQYNINLFGSSGRMSNSLSMLYESNQSNFSETYNKRYMLNFRSVASINKFLDFSAGGMVQYVDAHNNGVSLGDIQGLSPYDMLVNEDGTYADINRYYTPILNRFVPTSRFPYTDWTYNPITEIQNRDFSSRQLNVRVQGGLTLKVLRGLTIDSKIQYELFNTFNKNINNENTFAVRSAVNQATTWVQNTGVLTPNLPKGGTLAQSRSKGESYIIRNQINFNRNIGSNHELNVVAGSEVNNMVTEGYSNPLTYGYNDQTLSVGVFPNGPGGTFRTIQNWMGSNQTFSYTNSFSYRTERFFSFFGNAAHTYLDKYTLSASFRTDASNIITDDPQFRYDPFWSVGGAWQMHKEKFFSNLSFADRLTVRATYGFNGNIDRTTAVKPLINAGGVPNIYTNDPTATISSFGNPTLRWEKIGTWNLGLDYSFFKSKLFGSLNLYKKYSKDLIATLSIPAVNGTTSQKLNNAEMNNGGIEIEVGTVLPLKGKDFTWQASLNFSYNNNKITKLFVAQYAASTLYSGTYVEGENANAIWRFEYAGVTNTQPMVYGPLDKDGNRTKYDFGAFTPGDGRTYLQNVGTSVAPYTLGYLNTFRMKDFSLSFIITGKFGHVFQRKGFNYPPTWTSRVLPNVKLTEVMNGDPNKIVPLPQNDLEPRYFFWDRFHQYMSYLMENASHIRMQEVNFTYNLNNRLLSRTGITRAQVFAQGNDLFTWYANDAKEDPEYLLGTMNPRPKFTFGVKLEL